MKKRVISLALVSALSTVFVGCASDGLALNTLSSNKVDRYFHKGYIVSQKKVIIDDRETAVLTGAGVGGVGAGAATQSAKNGLIGAAVGGIIGAVVGKEITAYETIIKSGSKEYKGYLKQQLPKNTYVEFTIKDDKLKNVNVISKDDDVFLEKTAAKTPPKKPQNISIIKKEILISDRRKKGNLWYYKLADNTIVHSRSYYPYKGDLVGISYNEKTKQITHIKLIKSYTRRVRKPVIADKKYLIKNPENLSHNGIKNGSDIMGKKDKKSVQKTEVNQTKTAKSAAAETPKKVAAEARQTEAEPKKEIKKEVSVW